jgi:hypothetical protein
MKDGKFDSSVRDPTDSVFGYGRRCVTYSVLQAQTESHVLFQNLSRQIPGFLIGMAHRLFYPCHDGNFKLGGSKDGRG